VDGAVRYSADGEAFRAVPDVSALFFGSPDATVSQPWTPLEGRGPLVIPDKRRQAP
jgi:hypothetical protein